MDSKTALITGASSGIGKALAIEFAKDDWNLVLVARREQALEELAAELERDHHCKVQVIACDLSRDKAARVLFDETKSRNIVVDCLVNNAGRGTFGDWIEQDPDFNEDTIALNVVALTSLSHLYAKDMVKRELGYILNIASIAGFVPGPNLAVYHATKAFVLSFSEAIATELKGTGVSVTASCPGPTESEFFARSGSTEVKALKHTPIMSAEAVAREAYHAMLKGEPVKVHGLLNKLIVQSPRILPKAWIAPMVRRLTA
ncbi:SDR family NAD(P)-dependent oxidoreductase [Allohahella sp. A8]|uniref:SDR family NAD(P)-dependent oxidoreductase n=1 Tax=Allohahella sp. A8 TaxID=3141461 RepID=UPI000C099A05|nr:short-chain dehydrogenase [Hahellaceae bacterium]|tara:strand:+ start:67483 stop:68259 length:777 start_codon:yes stop_codon:yes gene_type:complete